MSSSVVTATKNINLYFIFFAFIYKQKRDMLGCDTIAIEVCL